MAETGAAKLFSREPQKLCLTVTNQLLHNILKHILSQKVDATMKEKINELSKSVEAEMIAHRNHIHMYPEVSFKEVETSAYVKAALDKYGLEYKAISNSVIARIKGKTAGKTIAFRADMDALAMQEKNDTPYRSKNAGVMHACGHDGHTAALLGLAQIFSSNKDLIEGEVVFIFQHAEEQLPGGAIELIEDNIMKDVDVIFGAHF